MPLTFSNDWRYDERIAALADEAARDLIDLIDKLAAQAPSRKQVYETFKHRFGDPATSTDTSWAQSDMLRAMDNEKMNAVEFLDSYWTALEDLKDDVKVPPADYIN